MDGERAGGQAIEADQPPRRDSNGAMGYALDSPRDGLQPQGLPIDVLPDVQEAEPSLTMAFAPSQDLDVVPQEVLTL